MNEQKRTDFIPKHLRAYFRRITVAKLYAVKPMNDAGPEFQEGMPAREYWVSYGNVNLLNEPGQYLMAHLCISEGDFEDGYDFVMSTVDHRFTSLYFLEGCFFHVEVCSGGTHGLILTHFRPNLTAFTHCGVDWTDRSIRERMVEVASGLVMGAFGLGGG